MIKLEIPSNLLYDEYLSLEANRVALELKDEFDQDIFAVVLNCNDKFARQEIFMRLQEGKSIAVVNAFSSMMLNGIEEYAKETARDEFNLWLAMEQR